jgi:hypothetical protein
MTQERVTSIGSRHPRQKRVEDARRRAYDPRVHLLRKNVLRSGWIAGSSPAMTTVAVNSVGSPPPCGEGLGVGVAVGARVAFHNYDPLPDRVRRANVPARAAAHTFELRFSLLVTIRNNGAESTHTCRLVLPASVRAHLTREFDACAALACPHAEEPRAARRLEA